MPPDNPKNILVVENKNNRPNPIVKMLTQAGYAVTTFDKGDDVLAALLKDPERYQTVLLDYEAPSNEGMGLFGKMNASSHLKILPSVLMIPNEDPTLLEAVIRSGVHYCFTPTFKPQLILNIIEAAVDDNLYYHRLQHSRTFANQMPAQHLASGHFQIRTLKEAQVVSNFLSQACPNPNLAVIGILELILNGIEHGNLGIGYEEKSHFKKNDTWMEEIEKRLKQPEHLNKKVDIYFSRDANDIRIQIVDQGQGFNSEPFMRLDKTRILDTHGRGIVMARELAFDELTYSGNGNTVTCRISLKPELQPSSKPSRPSF